MKTEDVGMMRAGNETRKGDWMETVSGKKFFPLDPRAEEIDYADVAHHLSRINRYNGAIRLEHYAVGYHTVLMAQRILELYGDPLLAYQALHHDDPEAFVTDIVRPVKRQPEMQGYRDIEAGLWRGLVDADPVLRRSCVGPDGYGMDPRIIEADNRILVDERAQVMNQSGHSWGIDHLEPLGVTIIDMSPNQVRAFYLHWHQYLLHLINR